jgi:hypothetical protein
MRISLDVEGEEAEAKWLAVRRVLTDVTRYLQEKGIRVAMVYSPCPHQHDPMVGTLRKAVGVEISDEWLRNRSEFEQRIAGLTDQLGVPFLSLTDIFREASAKHPSGYNYGLDEHWNAAGHRLAAEAIINWMGRAGLLTDGPSTER